MEPDLRLTPEARVRQRSRVWARRLSGLTGAAASSEALRLAPHSARGLADIRFRSERRRLGSIFLCHAPERLNDIIARRSVSVPCAELREFHHSPYSISVRRPQPG